MANQVSPGVQIKEIDLTNIIPTVATTPAGFAGLFQWGPVGVVTTISSQLELASRFGKPSNFNPEGWFSVYNFLSYGTAIQISRAANTTLSNTQTLSAFSVMPGSNALAVNAANQIVLNQSNFLTKQGTFDVNVPYVAKYPGSPGNSLRVSQCDSVNAYNSSMNLISNSTVINATSTSLSVNTGTNTALISVYFGGTGNTLNSNAVASAAAASLTTGDYIFVGNNLIGQQYLQISNIGAVTPIVNAAANNTVIGHSVTLNLTENYRLKQSYSTTAINRYWEFFRLIQNTPTQTPYVTNYGHTANNDELHVVVVDQGGYFTGVPGTVLEVFPNMSRVQAAIKDDNTTNYYQTVINQDSQYVWSVNDVTGAPSSTAANNVANSINSTPYNGQMQIGSDGLNEQNIDLATIAAGFDLFNNKDTVNVSLIVTGRAFGGIAGEGLSNYVIQNIAQQRKDCVAFISPPSYTVVNNVGNELNALLTYRSQNLTTSSYAFMDSGYKYQYDPYNNVYRWIPLNGDMAGLCARTDITNASYWSPAGYNRGILNNVTKLAYNPPKPDRDQLYPVGINPVILSPNDGCVLLGDKTLLMKPSAFDRINVRRLFILLEVSIAAAAKYELFEFNDAFTQNQFRQMITPFLKSIQGARGITDFYIVCDGSNNNGQVVDSNQFNAAIFIKPARSINFINLTFIAVGTDVQFSQVINTSTTGG